jgi:hypothetical protein
MTFTKGIISFERVSKLIVDNGGQIAELDDAKLTHVVLDKRDDSRRRELMKRTSKYGHLHSLPSFLRFSQVYAGQSTEIWFSPTLSRHA